MAILETEVEILLHGSNIKHYESLGVYIPRRIDTQGRSTVPKGTKIKVRVENLSNSSNVKLTKICDLCDIDSKSRVMPNQPYGLIQSHRTNDLDLCRICSTLNRWNDFRNNLKFEESLEYLFPEISQEWNEDKNGELKPSNVTPKSGIKVWWKCKNDKCFYEWETTVNDRYKGASCEKCFLESNRGKNHYKWNPLKTDKERLIERSYPEYQDWRLEVFERDNYTCQCCGNDQGGNLNAHHKDGYDWCLTRRTDVTNGVTLCEDCHLDFHFMHGYGYNTEEQFDEWISEFLIDSEIKNVITEENIAT